MYLLWLLSSFYPCLLLFNSCFAIVIVYDELF